MVKICTKCNIEYDIENFTKDKSTKDGYRSQCKQCTKQYYLDARKTGRYQRWEREYKSRPEVRTRINEYDKNYRKTQEYKEYKKEYISREHVKNRRRKYQRKSYHDNPQTKKRIISYITEKRKNDPVFRLNTYFSNQIRAALAGNKQGRKWETLVGYTLQELKEHIEKQFKEGMTWDNYGEWHIDHIKPKRLFNITSAECDEFKKCWALENLQPLWAFENLSKNGKYYGK